MGVGEDSGMGVGKDSGMVHEWVSSYFMAWHVGFQVIIGIFYSSFFFWNVDVKCKHLHVHFVTVCAAVPNSIQRLNPNPGRDPHFFFLNYFE